MLCVTRVVVVFLSQGLGRLNHAPGLNRVFHSRDVMREIVEKAVPKGDVGYDHGLGAAGLQQRLIGKQGRHERLGVGEGDAVAADDPLRRMLAARLDQFIEPGDIDGIRFRHALGLADPLRGETGIAADGDETLDVGQGRGAANRRDDVADVAPNEGDRLPGRFLERSQRFLKADGSEVAGLRRRDLALLQYCQQAAAAADLNDQGPFAIDAHALAERIPHGGDGEPGLLRRLDHLHVKAGRDGGAIEKGVGVVGLAYGTGRHGPDVFYPVSVENAVVVAQDGDGGVHRLTTEPPLEERGMAEAH